ncbi:conserved hypothetical protein [Catenulispora acidiphila DSM 44928]|uniref:SnoaL-like domain-containing protein n=1 Tax=Catenulispora acidiphila (strain DSM 44928 / JCM 14897 / NBRC 102108 / NRRL B-24433 / ID139908) TaxID=479433 RepID=C7Q8A6_CATAD|nr:hypothetical protein [Catenulispora acidiphila]ACU76094.1 conserved hypothetical protein [Catenulispora acidiphila DSM 44928]
MTNTTENTTVDATEAAAVVDRYIAVWAVADASDRAKAVANLWSDHGIEYIEGQQYIGHAALTDRVAEAHEAFVANATYTATGGDDVAVHADIVTFTIRLDHAQGPDAGETAWSARVFLVLDADGRVREDYQLTVKPLAA